MNISLVVCPNPYLTEPTAHFPVGILYVGGALLRAGHDTQIVDLRSKQDIVASDIPASDVVGITATTGEMVFARKIADIARSKGAKTMIGGAHATFCPDDVSDFDFVITGDGEVSSIIACNSLKPGVYSNPLSDISGYFPAWELIGKRGFSRHLFSGEGYGDAPLAAGVISSRGCAYNCSYCRTERDKIRYRPVDEVIHDIKNLTVEYGITHFRFYDECLTANRGYCLNLFAELGKLNIHFRAHTRCNLWSDDMAASAKDAGCEEMGFGFEAATDSILAKIRKQETVDQYRAAVQACKRSGIKSKAFWMTQLPGQNRDAIEDIKNFMLAERPDRWIISRFCPYPGSDVYEHPDQYGVSWIDTDISHYWNFWEEPTIEYHDLSKEEMNKHYYHLINWMENHFPKGAL